MKKRGARSEFPALRTPRHAVFQAKYNEQKERAAVAYLYALAHQAV